MATFQVPNFAGANRAIGFAFLISLALHAAVLWILPTLRSSQHHRGSVTAPIFARLVEPPPVANQVFLTPSAEPKPAAITQSAPKQRQRASPQPAVPLTPQFVVKNAPAPGAIEPAQASDAGTLAQYRLSVLSAARRFKDYPAVAVENHWQGKVEIRMVVDTDGEISVLDVRASAGHAVLDRHALEMIERAKPMAPIPLALRGKEFSVDIPVVFSLRDAGS